MKIFVAWLFLSFCPFLTGFAWAAGINYLLGFGEKEIAMTFAIQTLVWVFLFAGWFDGSKYQRAL